MGIHKVYQPNECQWFVGDAMSKREAKEELLIIVFSNKF